MHQILKVLIIEDHPVNLEVYQFVLQDISLNNELLDFDIDTAENCDIAFNKIKKATKKTFDIIILDISLPHTNNSEILSGEDLGIKINELMPSSKILIITALNDNYRMYNILKNIQPMGFLIKSDINTKDIKRAVHALMNNHLFYSNSVLELQKNNICADFLLDKIDRQLLFELSIGTRMKDLPSIIPLSMAGIEKRRRRLKEIFEVVKLEDRDLVLKAKLKGFI